MLGTISDGQLYKISIDSKALCLRIAERYFPANLLASLDGSLRSATALSPPSY